jgi:hypothetical protein
MESLNDVWNELIERLQHGRELGYAGFEPVYYLIFSPNQILEVKRRMPAWMTKLRNKEWDVHTFSIAEQILDILRNSPLRKIWIAADRKNPLEWDKTNKALSNAIETNGELESRLMHKLEELEKQKNPILLVTDLEALHPYIRIGVIESKLQGKFRVPTVFLYPGERTGKTKLKFLKFYPEDGNYRSVHIGG